MSSSIPRATGFRKIDEFYRKLATTELVSEEELIACAQIARNFHSFASWPDDQLSFMQSEEVVASLLVGKKINPRCVVRFVSCAKTCTSYVGMALLYKRILPFVASNLTIWNERADERVLSAISTRLFPRSLPLAKELLKLTNWHVLAALEYIWDHRRHESGPRPDEDFVIDTIVSCITDSVVAFDSGRMELLASAFDCIGTSPDKWVQEDSFFAKFQLESLEIKLFTAQEMWWLTENITPTPFMAKLLAPAMHGVGHLELGGYGWRSFVVNHRTFSPHPNNQVAVDEFLRERINLVGQLTGAPNPVSRIIGDFCRYSCTMST